MGRAEVSEEPSGAAARTPPPLNARSLEQLDAATPVAPIHDDLVFTSPARDLLAQLGSLVASLRAIDVEAVARKQGWFSRLTGSDLEARIKLEAACVSLARQMQASRQAAVATASAAELMLTTRGQLRDDQRRLDHLIRLGREMLDAERATADPELVARLERRVANMTALHASNTLAYAQLQIAGDHAQRLLDRFTDVDKLLFPVWQRHAMAVAATPTDPQVARSRFAEFKTLHARMITGASLPEEAKAP